MKPQDIIFLAILVFFIWKKSANLCVLAGFVCLLISIPLFSAWIFFTAERLTWYAAAFFLLAIIRHLTAIRKEITK